VKDPKTYWVGVAELAEKLVASLPDDADPEVAVDAFAAALVAFGGQLHSTRCLVSKVINAAGVNALAKTKLAISRADGSN
jgi:hypothetical protein